GYTITSDIVEIQEGVVIMHCVARLGTTEVWDDSAGQHGCEITEAEDNGNFNNANLLSAEDCLSKQQGMKIQGELSSFEDVDIFKMDGQWLPGDVIVIESPNSILNMRVALFDEKGELLGLYFPGRVLDIIFSHRIFYQLRTRHESLYLALANHGSTNSQGEYSVKIKKSPGEEIVPSSQRVFLNFEGTTEKFMISKKVIDGVLKLEDSWLNSAYPERIEEIKRKIKDVVVENYRNFNVEVYTIEDGLPEEPYSTVYFGGDEKALLGYANSVDTYNQNHADKAIVFVESFELYHSSGLGTINEDKIARFIGNVASHELGHLLGLFHVSDCADIMDTTCSASAGMSDQEFKTSEIHSSSFKVGKQNSPNLLEYATGRSA
ncbi:MAG: hypothetical protein KJ600_04935, partial [Nanoarchaeota archaeon]|nr:hypothetical protein [Nanoarchaeota archaeon]